jgi:hypothetical protein
MQDQATEMYLPNIKADRKKCKTLSKKQDSANMLSYRKFFKNERITLAADWSVLNKNFNDSDNKVDDQQQQDSDGDVVFGER